MKFITLNNLQRFFNKLTTVFTKPTDVEDAITNALTDYTTTNDMNSAIASAIADIDHLKREIVTELPEIESADENTIYMLLKDTGEENENVYLEYFIIDGEWEIIGDTKVDLEGYIKDTDFEEITDAEIDSLFE